MEYYPLEYCLRKIANTFGLKDNQVKILLLLSFRASRGKEWTINMIITKLTGLHYVTAKSLTHGLYNDGYLSKRLFRFGKRGMCGCNYSLTAKAERLIGEYNDLVEQSLSDVNFLS